MVAWGCTREKAERKEQEIKKSLSQMVWKCKSHIVLLPKIRRKIVYGKLSKELGMILRQLREYKAVEAI